MKSKIIALSKNEEFKTLLKQKKIFEMANHPSAIKRVRSDQSKRLRNRYQLKTCRTFVKKLRKLTDKQQATEDLKTVVSMLDKLAKRHIIHKNESTHQKSTLTKWVNQLKG